MNILFLCTENSARSLMAEALLTHHAPESVEVYSAGTHPTTPSPIGLSLLKSINLENDFLYSKSLEELSDIDFDMVITLCENAASECQQMSDGLNYEHWTIPDPKVSNTEESFAQALHQINHKIESLLSSLTDYKKAMLAPVQFYKCLADDIRLQSLLLILREGELCVCELMTALNQDSQPKVSRHLAQLKKQGLLVDRKQQQWVFYRINATLPSWMKSILTNTLVNEPYVIHDSVLRLETMGDRPSRQKAC